MHRGVPHFAYGDVDEVLRGIYSTNAVLNGDRSKDSNKRKSSIHLSCSRFPYLYFWSPGAMREP